MVVLGIGDGEIAIVLDRKEYAPGDKVSGNLIFRLDSPVKARGVKLSLFGERKELHRHYTGKYASSHPVFVRVFHEKQFLASKKSFRNGDELPFSFKLPGGALFEVKKRGVLAEIFAGLEPKTEWFISATLDIPMAFDISSKTKVNVKQ
jgi:hypothetical protein